MKKVILDEKQKELFDDLSDENAGKLIKSIFEYVVTGEQLGISSEIKIPFMMIAQEIDTDKEKQEEVKIKRSNAGKIGMEKRWNKTIIEEKPIEQSKKRIVFKAPKQEEIEQYIAERKLSVNGKYFYEYFTEGNWIDSKGNKVKNWKQKLLTWDKYSKPKKEKKYEFEKSEEQEKFEFLYE